MKEDGDGRKVTGNSNKYTIHVSTGSNAFGLFETILRENPETWAAGTHPHSSDVIIPHNVAAMAIAYFKKNQIISRYPNMWLVGRKDVF